MDGHFAKPKKNFRKKQGGIFKENSNYFLYANVLLSWKDAFALVYILILKILFEMFFGILSLEAWAVCFIDKITWKNITAAQYIKIGSDDTFSSEKLSISMSIQPFALAFVRNPECIFQHDLFRRSTWNHWEAVIEKASQPCSCLSSFTPVLLWMLKSKGNETGW